VIIFTLPSSLPAGTVLTPVATTEEQTGRSAPKPSCIQILKIRPMKIGFFWNLMACSLVKVYRRFEGNQIIWRHIKEGHRCKNDKSHNAE
jgi:hypothetical protein